MQAVDGALKLVHRPGRVLSLPRQPGHGGTELVNGLNGTSAGGGKFGNGLSGGVDCRDKFCSICQELLRDIRQLGQLSHLPDIITAWADLRDPQTPRAFARRVGLSSPSLNGTVKSSAPVSAFGTPQKGSCTPRTANIAVSGLLASAGARTAQRVASSVSHTGKTEHSEGRLPTTGSGNTRPSAGCIRMHGARGGGLRYGRHSGWRKAEGAISAARRFPRRARFCRILITIIAAAREDAVARSAAGDLHAEGATAFSASFTTIPACYDLSRTTWRRPTMPYVSASAKQQDISLASRRDEPDRGKVRESHPRPLLNPRRRPQMRPPLRPAIRRWQWTRPGQWSCTGGSQYGRWFCASSSARPPGRPHT